MIKSERVQSGITFPVIIFGSAIASAVTLAFFLGWTRGRATAPPPAWEIIGTIEVTCEAADGKSNLTFSSRLIPREGTFPCAPAVGATSRLWAVRMTPRP